MWHIKKKLLNTLESSVAPKGPGRPLETTKVDGYRKLTLVKKKLLNNF